MHNELPRELRLVKYDHHQHHTHSEYPRQSSNHHSGYHMNHHMMEMPAFDHNMIPTSALRDSESQSSFHRNRHTWHSDMSKYRRQKAIYYHALSRTTANPFKRWIYASKAARHRTAARDHYRKQKLHDLKSRLHTEKGDAAFRYVKPQRYRY